MGSITHGRSSGCEGQSAAGLNSSYVPNAGWDAIEGWDPVTGLGTPLFDELLKLSTPNSTWPSIGDGGNASK